MNQDMVFIKNIIGRDGVISSFNRDVFNSGIEKAALEVGQDISLDAIYECVLLELQPLLKDLDNNPLHVDSLLDAVEIGLMDAGYSDVARSFIKYRRIRDRNRELGSVYSKAIAEINMNFEFDGNLSKWLWAIGTETATQYILLADMPNRTARIISENYLDIQNIIGFGRTIERVAVSIQKLLDSEYLIEQNITKAGHLSVVMSHLIFMYDALSSDIAGEQCWVNIDKDLGEIIRKLKHKPSEFDIRQSIQAFVYTLNAKTRIYTNKHLSITIGLDETAEGQTVSKILLESLLVAHESGVSVFLPHISFILTDKTINKENELLELAVKLGLARGGVSFHFINNPHPNLAIYSDGINSRADKIIPLVANLNVPRLVAVAGPDFNTVFKSVLSAFLLATTRHSKRFLSRVGGNFLVLNKIPFTNETNIITDSDFDTIPLMLVGLGEASRMLARPGGGLDEVIKAGDALISRMSSIINDADNINITLYPQTSSTKAQQMYSRDRSQVAEKYGIRSYLPSPSVLPIGFSFKERIHLEEPLYSVFKNQPNKSFININSVVFRDNQDIKDVDNIIALLKQYNTSLSIVRD